MHNTLKAGDLVCLLTKNRLGLVTSVTPNWTYVYFMDGKRERHSYSILRLVAKISETKG